MRGLEIYFEIFFKMLVARNPHQKFKLSALIILIIIFLQPSPLLAANILCAADQYFNWNNGSLDANTSKMILSFHDENGSFLLGEYNGEKTSLNGGGITLKVEQPLTDKNELVAFHESTDGRYYTDTIVLHIRHVSKASPENLIFLFYLDDKVLAGRCLVRGVHQRTLDVLKQLESNGK